MLQRVRYRVRQFVRAVVASLLPLDNTEEAEARAYLPEAAWPLFAAMAPPDQRHGLDVLCTLRASGYDQPALMQAALLHDCAKREGGVRLWHRVAIVLLKAFRPETLARWADAPAPPRDGWHYPLWAQVNHPRRGAELAKAAGCDPVAVTLIRRHHDSTGDQPVYRLLVALQAADDDN